MLLQVSKTFIFRYIPPLMEETARQMKLTYDKPTKKNFIWLASESWDRNNEGKIISQSLSIFKINFGAYKTIKKYN